jgi:hypothetical protein
VQSRGDERIEAARKAARCALESLLGAALGWETRGRVSDKWQQY